MSLALYYHPLSSFCQKALIALYENETPFERHIVDLADAASAAAFKAIWPVGRFPVLRDMTAERTIPESSIIIEYLDRHRPGKIRFVPDEADLALQVRMSDRFFDLYINVPVGKIVTDTFRPSGEHDDIGVAQARAMLLTAYGLIERERTAAATWAVGDAFSMADCAAAPALFYANKVQPFGEAHPRTAAYFERLMARPSFARAVEEAKPYLKLFPL